MLDGPNGQRQVDTAKKNLPQLRYQLGIIKAKEENLESKIADDNSGRVPASTLQKQYHQADLVKVQGEVFQLETQISALEKLIASHKTLNTAEYKAMDNPQEQEQSNDGIATNSPAEPPNEDKLEQELEALEQDPAPGTDPASAKPATAKQPAEEEDDEAELKRLQAEMAMG